MIFFQQIDFKMTYIMFELEPKYLWNHRLNLTMCFGRKWCLLMKKIKYIKNNV